jgi:hypothetical protein
MVDANGTEAVGILFADYRQDVCCLCGSVKALTGEHKIKASALRAEFGSENMVIGNSEDPSTYRTAQGVKSKALHFTAPLCAKCNNVETQAADHEFDRFLNVSRELVAFGKDPRLVFEDERFVDSADAYLNVFRYFAKLLCCHIAELHAPRPRHLARFARGIVSQNCVWLDVIKDPTYKQISAEIGQQSYAAHGGLIVYGNKKSGAANAFHSTLTVGPICYVFFSRLNWFEKNELQFMHRDFHNWCRARVRDTIKQPLTGSQLVRLGLSSEEHRGGQ